MNIRPIAIEDVPEWPGCAQKVFTAPAGMEDEVGPAQTMAGANPDTGDFEIHVPWQPDEIDLVRLAHGGTIWLTVIGGLPPHLLEVRGGER